MTGEPRVVVPERSNTYIEIQPLRLLDGGKQADPLVRARRLGPLLPVRRGRQGDPADHVRRVRRRRASTSIDEKTRTLYFNAAGREAGEDPYFTHLYRVNIDTGDDQAAQSRQRVARGRR